MKKNRMEEITDAEFLSFLYAEREREESLNSYQGWNLWAVVGVMITVACAGYNMLCKRQGEIDLAQTGYLISFVIASLIICRPLIMMYIKSRERGVDPQKIKYLKDVVPWPYLCITILCSMCLSVFFLMVEYGNHWTLMPYLWFLMSLLYIFARISIVFNKDKIVRSHLDGFLFANETQEVWFGAVVGGVSGLIIGESVKFITLPVIGSPGFELAIYILAFVILSYLLLKIKNSEKTSVRIDVLLDDYIYKNRSKESIFQQISNHRMGSGVMEACSHELYEIKNAFDDFEPKKHRLEGVIEMLSDDNYDGKDLHENYILVKESNLYLGDCNNRLEALENKMKQIADRVPSFGLTQECKGLMTIRSVLLERETEMMSLVKEAVKSMQKWHEKYHCKKYCSWCTRKDCDERYDRMLLKCRLRLWVMMLFPKTVKYFSAWKDGC